MKNILAVFLGILLLSGCYYDNLEELHPSPPPCDTIETSFVNDILPIMNTSCGGLRSDCHQNDATASGYGLGNYTDVINTINGSGVFLETITHDPSINSSKWMPKGTSAKIDDCSILKIEAWLNEGSLNN